MSVEHAEITRWNLNIEGFFFVKKKTVGFLRNQVYFLLNVCVLIHKTQPLQKRNRN